MKIPHPLGSCCRTPKVETSRCVQVILETINQLFSIYFEEKNFSMQRTLYLAIKLHCKKFEGNLEEKRLKGKVPLFEEIHE
jgi:hypothetical protein